ncbi:phosphodiesterase [Halothiobacillus sp. DCM-1]|uniref:phosphodiesterase n=1 Tax=Halothiobacillus sp. DCM-1 TaxID=3112558 RepID=UPI003252825C
MSAPSFQPFLLPDAPAIGAHDRIQRLITAADTAIAFQPFIDVLNHQVHGYEALARPAAQQGFADISQLLQLASSADLRAALELHLCHQAIQAFHQQQLNGRLFLNLSPEALGHADFSVESLLDALRAVGLPFLRVVIELTEQQATDHPERLQANLNRLRTVGILLALDDFAAGYNGMLHWLHRQPDIVKIDRALLSGIDRIPKKYRFVRAVVHLAKESGALIVAEGIEHMNEAQVLAGLGVDFLQGYLFGRPAIDPVRALEPEIIASLTGHCRCTGGQDCQIDQLIQPAPAIQLTERIDEVMTRFLDDPELRALPVLDGALPVGIAWRHDLMNLYATPYGRPLNERRSISRLMDRRPVIVDQSESLTALSRRISERDHRNFHDVFIITRGREYAGIGQLIDLLRLFTQEQIRHAQHLNPLTGLPGNVPIIETLRQWLNEEIDFVLVYADLDYFKAVNDYYGFQRGDRMIGYLNDVLKNHCHPARDFLGHVGGDDFVMLFRSADWQAQCAAILEAFDAGIAQFYDADAQARGGIETTDREGRFRHYPYCSLTLAALPCPAPCPISVEALTEQASHIKKQGKQIHGSVLEIGAISAEHPMPAPRLEPAFAPHADRVTR